jgi:hypothetical protein
MNKDINKHEMKDLINKYVSNLPNDSYRSTGSNISIHDVKINNVGINMCEIDQNPSFSYIGDYL